MCSFAFVQVRPYLIDTVRGHVLTTQHKAWNDAVGTCCAVFKFVVEQGPLTDAPLEGATVPTECGAHRYCHVRRACVGPVGQAPHR